MSSAEKVIDLINQENTPVYPLTTSVISFSDLTPDEETSWNTKLTVNAIPGQGYIGTVDIFYRRINLTELGLSVYLASEAPFTVSSFLEKLNNDRLTSMTEEDLEPDFLPSMDTGVPTDVLITATDGSLAWRGNVTVQVVTGLPETYNALHTLLNETLPADGYF